MDIRNKKVLLIEDEDSLRHLLSKIISLEGFNVISASDATSGLDMLRRENVLVVVTDVKLPDINGIEVTEKIKSSFPFIEVIVLTAFSNVKDGVRAMKIGAFDYLTKGEGDEKLPLVVKKAMEKAAMNSQLFELEHRLDSKSNFAKIIGKSSSINKTIELAKKVAGTDTTVLILGETGTGKELIAEAIHMASRRRKGPFIPINCAAIPKDLQESELFGHKKGAFTGASQDKKGYFEVADRGTIFLDELGEMSSDLQAKLLRSLENRIIYRVGDTEPIPIDVRIIAATNKELLTSTKEEFRRDLYYRLSTFTIELPPLKERFDDIELLAIHFMRIYADKNNRNIVQMSPSFMEKLVIHDWPGNIRELKNVIERAVILADHNILTEDLLPSEFMSSHKIKGSSSSGNSNGDIDLRSIEKNHIIRILNAVKGNKSEAAKKLDIGLATLYRKLKEYGLDQ